MALKRRIGFGLLTFYGVGVMVGAGIYVLVGKVAAIAGPLTPLAFLVAGAAAGLTALSFAELAARIPESGGEAAYTRVAYRSAWFGDAIGLAVIAVGIVSAAAILKGGVGYILAFVDAPRLLLEIACGVALGLIAAIGVAESLRVAAAFTIVEAIGLIAVAAAGFMAEPVISYGDMVELDAIAAGAPAILAAAALAFFAFIGFEDMVNLAEETVDPVRAMPRAVIAAVLISSLLYAVVAVAALRAAPVAELAASERPLALVFEAGSGGSSAMIAFIAIFATLNGVLAQIVMAARVLYGLGRSNHAFAWAHHAHSRLGTPLAATAAATAIVIGLAALAPIEELAVATTTILLVIFVIVNGALLLLKRREPPPAGAPNVPVVLPWLAILCSLALLAA